MEKRRESVSWKRALIYIDLTDSSREKRFSVGFEIFPQTDREATSRKLFKDITKNPDPGNDEKSIRSH